MHIKLFVLVLSFMLLFPFLSNAYAMDADSISASSAVLMAADTGEIIFEKNAHVKRPIASTTKIMTSLLALESGKKLDEITVSDEMIRVEGTSMGLLAGDKVNLKTLIYGMLLKSGNDAANAAAITVAGTKEDFAVLMNERAKKINMLNTNFVTPSGLDSKNHYSTAYDMALLAREAMKNPEFSYICKQKSAVVYYGNPPYRRVLKNHNKLLWSCDEAIGIKTGFTKKSGRCLVSAAEKDGLKLIAVTLNAPNDWQDHKKLFDYGFENISKQNIASNLNSIVLRVAGGEKNEIKLKQQYIPCIAQINNKYISIKEKIYIKRFEYAPIKMNTIVGEIHYYVGNKLMYKVPLLTKENCAAA